MNTILYSSYLTGLQTSKLKLKKSKCLNSCLRRKNRMLSLPKMGKVSATKLLNTQCLICLKMRIRSSIRVVKPMKKLLLNMVVTSFKHSLTGNWLQLASFQLSTSTMKSSENYFGSKKCQTWQSQPVNLSGAFPLTIAISLTSRTTLIKPS